MEKLKLKKEIKINGTIKKTIPPPLGVGFLWLLLMFGLSRVSLGINIFNSKKESKEDINISINKNKILIFKRLAVITK